MAIYVHNRRNEWVKSFDNYPFIMWIHITQAKSRVWQLLITPEHIFLGAIHGYTSQAIYMFVRRHLKEVFDRRLC